MPYEGSRDGRRKEPRVLMRVDPLDETLLDASDLFFEGRWGVCLNLLKLLLCSIPVIQSNPFLTKIASHKFTHKELLQFEKLCPKFNEDGIAHWMKTIRYCFSAPFIFYPWPLTFISSIFSSLLILYLFLYSWFHNYLENCNKNILREKHSLDGCNTPVIVKSYAGNFKILFDSFY